MAQRKRGPSSVAGRFSGSNASPRPSDDTRNAMRVTARNARERLKRGGFSTAMGLSNARAEAKKHSLWNRMNTGAGRKYYNRDSKGRFA